MENCAPVAILFFAFLVDSLIGDPIYRFHPIRIIGYAITTFLKLLKGIGLNTKTGGVVLVLLTTGSALAAYLGMRSILCDIHTAFALLFDLFICYSCLALRDLDKHIIPVVSALRAGDLPAAKKAVAMVVGRDVSVLDAVGVTRAAVETLSENFVDGFLSPVFWYVTGVLIASYLELNQVVLSVCLIVTFKVASTLDSMVGYRNEAFYKIGWAGAKMDDVMNFVPARLCLVILFAGSFLSGLNPFAGMRTALNDRLKHDSPNAAHAESFTAGALGVRLGGPIQYPEGIKEKAWLGGEGSPDPEVNHIEKTMILINQSAWISMVSMLLMLVFAFCMG